MTRRRILVPIDFGAQSDAALLYARKIAANLNEMISCIYVIEDHGKASDRLTSKEFKHKIRREAEQRLSERVNSILKQEDYIDFELIITSGKVNQKILEKAMDLNVRLIVMGKSNSADNIKNLIGSNTRQVIAKSQVPVITICSQNTIERKNIILPLELSRSISNPIKSAIEIALRLHARIIVVSVIEKEMISLTPVYKNTLKDIKLLLKDLSIPCDTHLLPMRTSVSKEINSFSSRIDSGLVLMMTKNETNHPRSYIGSTVKEVIANSEVPVQCFNPNSCSGISDEDSKYLSEANPLAGFIMKGHLINNQKEA